MVMSSNNKFDNKKSHYVKAIDYGLKRPGWKTPRHNTEPKLKTPEHEQKSYERFIRQVDTCRSALRICTAQRQQMLSYLLH